MATIKAYTDLEQSKKLAEILPLESVDMCYINNKAHLGFLYEEYCEFGDTILQDYYPCWSLAALLDILPRSIEFKDDEYYLRFVKDYVEYANDEISIIGRCLHTTGNNNLVDACYEMIICLNELKML